MNPVVSGTVLCSEHLEKGSRPLCLHCLNERDGSQGRIDAAARAVFVGWHARGDLQPESPGHVLEQYAVLAYQRALALEQARRQLLYATPGA